MPALERIRVHPVKSLDAADRSAATVAANGGLEWDRRYAIVERDPGTDESAGRYVNGKREPRLHELAASYDLDRGTITVDAPGEEDERRFHLDLDRDCFASWLSEYLGYPVEIVREDDGGFPDDTDAAGPTVIAARTLEAVASWYDDIDAAEMCRRLRPNLVVGDAPAFWEDRLYETPDRLVPFEIGSIELEGVNPCQRCVVPTRDPDTGVETDGFRETFVERRRETLPAWAGEAWFDHYFRLMVNTRVPDTSWGDRLAIDDEVTVGDAIPAR